MSDMWAAYAHIQDINNGIYMHAQVNHSHHFVYPIDPDIHTQNVENMWMRAKRKLKRQFGTSPELFPSYLDEFIFHNEGNQNATMFAQFILALQKNYP